MHIPVFVSNNYLSVKSFFFVDVETSTENHHHRVAIECLSKNSDSSAQKYRSKLNFLHALILAPCLFPSSFKVFRLLIFLEFTSNISYKLALNLIFYSYFHIQFIIIKQLLEFNYMCLEQISKCN